MSSDAELFRQTIGEVQAVKQDKVALHEQRKSKPKPYPKPLIINFDAHLTCRNMEDVDIVGMYDSMSFVSTGIQNNVLKKLRRGFFGIDAEIDLHGLNSQHAKNNYCIFYITVLKRGAVVLTSFTEKVIARWIIYRL